MDRKAEIIDALTILQKSDKAAGKVFESRAYQTAITHLKALPAITSVDDVAGIKGVGKQIQLKVKEILETGSLRAAEDARSKPEFAAYDALLKVYGIGPVKAKALVADGVTSIEELRRRAAPEGSTSFTADPVILTAAQKLGLQYYEDSLERIPRAEILVHQDILKQAFEQAGLKMEIVGSFRRKAATSGDIDCLVTSDSMADAEMKRAFKAAVEVLLEKEYIVGVLAKGAAKTLAFAKAGSAARRLDLLLTGPAEYPYAILYFTGSDLFNIAMRAWALERGYTMNEHTMTPIASAAAGASAAAPPLMKSEEDIFAFLGLQYVPPEERVDARQIMPLAAAPAAPVPALAPTPAKRTLGEMMKAKKK